ncbi:hypothetical protein CVT25_009187 [Psilocybe cyanescens]|uniref:SHSP domain-containing protein n=1 Tax=Psilocybe cyanescens TaxID=93625 RepID=A0A409WWG3_PSICY|nr:hypothetical protein CVT25_009187 [Psilocybe cyanescens]
MSRGFFYQPYYDFDRLFKEAFSARQASGELEIKNMVTATFELQELIKDNINIDVHSNRLTHAKNIDEHEYAVRDGQYGKFSRTLLIQLPTEVKSEAIKANMDNGILTVTFLKSTPGLPPKKISILS